MRICSRYPKNNAKNICDISAKLKKHLCKKNTRINFGKENQSHGRNMVVSMYLLMLPVDPMVLIMTTSSFDDRIVTFCLKQFKLAIHIAASKYLT